MAVKDWANVYVFGPSTGALRGLMETETVFGVGSEGIPPGFLTQANNIAFNSEGRPRKRPGRTTITSFTGRTSPGWVGENSGLLYDADANALRQAGTSVSTAFAGNALLLSHTNYVTAAAVAYLIVTDGTTVRKITGTTASAITGIPAVPEVVCAAGNRLFGLRDNDLFWSIPNATLGAAGEWPTDNELSMAVRGLQDGKAMVEFGGFLFVYGAGSVLQIDPRDPLGSGQNIVLSDIGAPGPRAVVKGKDSIFFTDSRDVYRWSPGAGMPVSIAELQDGKSLVRGTISSVAGSNPYDITGFDGDNDILLLSNDTNTLAYDVKRQAWSQWTFGADSWTVVADVLCMTETGLTESLQFDWTDHADTVAAATVLFDVGVTFAPLRTDADSEVALKNVLLVFPANGDLTDTVIECNIIRNGQTVVGSRTVSITETGVMVWDTDNWADETVDAVPLWGGGAGIAEARIPYEYPQGRLLQVQFTVTDNNPFLVNSLLSQIQERRVNAA